ncbi:hypothetical protein B0H34DRAFT_803536 [Crassisporium funariophilum]|nr:hypothetical protein B0H34DRAFT_803536 [Crassisporium funariophilum]
MQSDDGDIVLIGNASSDHLNTHKLSKTSALVQVAHIPPSGHVADERGSLFLRMLPSEIAAEIFILSIPDFEIYESRTTDVSAPLKLGAVCSVWRNIAWATPMLWSSLTLKIPKNSLQDNDAMPGYLALLEEWITRSGTLPLSIRLTTFSVFSVPWGKFPGRELFDILNEHAARWRDFILNIPCSCWQYLRGNSQSFPLLRSFAVRPPDNAILVRQLQINDSPQLRHLSICCIFLSTFSCRWDLLLSLCVEMLQVDECLEVLSRTPQLVHLSIRNTIYGEGEYEMPEKPLFLSQLQTFQYINNEADDNRSDDDVDVAEIIDKITTPKLRDFSYTGGKSQRARIKPITAFFTRSACSLDTLTIVDTHRSQDRDPYTGDEDLLDLFRQLTSLTRIWWSKKDDRIGTNGGNSPLTDSFLQMCNPEIGTETCLLPSLESISYTGPKTFSWPILIPMLEARCRTSGQLDAMSTDVACIKEVTLQLYDDESPLEMDNVVESKLQRLAENGILIRRSTIKAWVDAEQPKFKLWSSSTLF